jgi:hypothetical protein
LRLSVTLFKNQRWMIYMVAKQMVTSTSAIFHAPAYRKPPATKRPMKQRIPMIGIIFDFILSNPILSWISYKLYYQDSARSIQTPIQMHGIGISLSKRKQSVSLEVRCRVLWHLGWQNLS